MAAAQLRRRIPRMTRLQQNDTTFVSITPPVIAYGLPNRVCGKEPGFAVLIPCAKKISAGAFPPVLTFSQIKPKTPRQYFAVEKFLGHLKARVFESFQDKRCL
jgi:hypothetical protein